MLEIVSLADLGHPSLPAPGNFLSAPSLAQAHPAGAEEIVMGGVGMLSEVSVCGVSWLGVSLCSGAGGFREGRRGDFKDWEWGWQEALRPWWVLVPKDTDTWSHLSDSHSPLTTL